MFIVNSMENSTHPLDVGVGITVLVSPQKMSNINL
jgi:hypothetical protein